MELVDRQVIEKQKELLWVCRMVKRAGPEIHFPQPMPANREKILRCSRAMKGRLPAKK